MATTVDQPDMVPTRKVTAGVIAGALTVLMAELLKQFAGYNMDATVATAITTLFSFAVAWFVRDAE